MPTRTEIVEAGARAFYEFSPLTSWDNLIRVSPEIAENHRKHMESAYSAMLPLIKESLAAEVRKHKRGINDWNDNVREQSARLIEGYEPAP